MKFKLFWGNHKLQKGALIHPFIYTVPSITKITVSMLCLLCVQVAMLILSRSYNAVAVVVAASLGTTAANLGINYCHKANNFSVIPSLVQGMMIGLLSPATYPVVTVFFVSFLVMAFSKIFGGHLSHSWYNTVALTVVILWIVGAKEFPASIISADRASLASPSIDAIQAGDIKILKFDSAITDFMNKVFFSFIGVNVPDGYVSLLWDNGSAIAAFRFNIITIISSIILVSIDMVSVAVPFVFLGTYVLLIRFLMPLFFGGIFGQGDILIALLTGGTLFCALYLLQWFGTVPSTFAGKIIYAALGGVTAFFVCGYGMSSVGMVFTILICDLMSAAIQVVEERKNRQKVRDIVLREREKNAAYLAPQHRNIGGLHE